MGCAKEFEEASAKAGLRPGVEQRTPRHLEKLRLYQQGFAAALPLESAEPLAVTDPRALHRAALEARLALFEADREARLAVIQKQGAELDLLRAALERARQLADGDPPKTVLGMAPPSEVRRVTETLAAIAALAKR